MTKERAGKNDWTLADAAVDTQWFINCWDTMSEREKLNALGNLMDRLLEGIENADVLKDAEKRIEALQLEAAA